MPPAIPSISTARPVLAGILLAIAGAVPLIFSLVAAFLLLPRRPLFPSMLASVLLLIAGVLPLVGAVYSFNRRLWPVVVALGITALLVDILLVVTIPLTLLVIAALILTLLSRREYV